MRKKHITICIPCFNEEDNIINSYRAIEKELRKINNYTFSYLFVDNGSTDSSRNKILSLIKKDKRIQSVLLSRNFGPEASAAALIDFAKGDAIITLPCDLQDPPSLIPKFIKKWREGNNMVIGVYRKTEDDIVTSVVRRVFYSFFKRVSNIDIPVNASGVGLMDQKAYTAMRSLPEKYRFFRGLRSWIGFKIDKVLYDRKSRDAGKSSYSLIAYFKHAERGIYGFSYLLLDVLAYLSLIFVAVSVGLTILYIGLVAFNLVTFSGSVLIFLTILSFGSAQLLAIGILGKYIQVIMEETKNRPTYIIDQKINFK